MNLPPDLVRAAARTPFYRSLLAGARPRPALPSWPPVDLEALLRGQEARDDPFGGRRDPRRPPRAVIQAGDGLPLYWALGRTEMAEAARALAHSWRGLGIRPGQRVAIYDYGTSPLTLFASAHYLPYLRAGAADLLGCVPICNDGLPEMAFRALHLLRYVRPQTLFVNGEAMEALLSQALRQGWRAEGLDCTVVVSTDEEAVPPAGRRRWSEGLGLPVRSLLRADAALFFAYPCPQGEGYHASPRHYLLEVLSEEGRQPVGEAEVGLLTVTNLFLRSCPVIRYVTDLRASLRPGPCPCGAPEPAILPAEP